MESSGNISTFDKCHQIDRYENNIINLEIAQQSEVNQPIIVNQNESNRIIIVPTQKNHNVLKKSSIVCISWILYVILSILIGTLIVYFTSAKPKHICERVYQHTITHIKSYRSQPRSVAIADFNNDKQLDFVVVNTGLNNIDIYLGRNNETFEYYTTYSTGSESNPYSVAVGNFDNRDGIDIAVANFGTNTIGIFFGFNNGNFKFIKSFSTGSSRPLFIKVADLNNDHQLDIATVNYGTNSIGIFLGSEDGSFTLAIIYPTGYDSFPKSLAIADLNNDNQSDLVVANYGTDNVGVFFGYGNGTFADQKIFHIGFRSNPSSVVVANIDYDNYMDIIVSNYGTGNITILFGDENGNFTKNVAYSIGSNSRPEFIAVYDFNRDNHFDIMAIDSVNENIYILPGNDDGIFPLLSIYSSDFGSNPIFVDAADFNNDNRSDVLIVNRGDNNILLLMEYEIIISAKYSTLTTMTIKWPVSIVSGDLNHDNLLDLVVFNQVDGLINVFLGYGNGTFMLFSTISTEIISIVKKAILNDFNNDHHLDIVILHTYEKTFSILLGHGNGLFTTMGSYLTETSSESTIVASDVNEDQCLDIVITNDILNSISIYIGYCNGSFEMILTHNAENGSNLYDIVMDDFNGDNHVDFAVTYGNYGGISIYFGDGHGGFPTFKTYQIGDTGRGITIASSDFNNDNRTDIAVGLIGIGAIAIFVSYGNGSFDNLKIYPIESCALPTSMIVGDFNSDNQLDLAITCISNGKIAILFGDNNGEFWSQANYLTGENSQPYAITSGDFNKDNKLDIAITTVANHKVGILINYYKAEFAIQKKYSTGSSPQPNSVAIGDFNNDTIPDLVVINSGNKNMGIQVGFGNGSFGTETIYPIDKNLFSQYVTTGDFNRDDQLDVVIVNSKGDNIIIFLGTGDGTFENTLTYPMNLQSSPTCAAIGDFNNDNWLDLVVTNSGTDNLGILYGYNYVHFVLHQTLFIDNRSFPKIVEIIDMNNDNQLDIVVANQNSASVSIFFGDGNGSFKTPITYYTGGYSQYSAMAVGNLNNDNYLDIIVSNPAAESMSVLLGNDNGTFEILLSGPINASSISLAVIVDDVNNDNQSDVIMTDGNSNSVNVFLGYGNGTLSLLTTYFTGQSAPLSIALGDLNHDNYLDIVFVLTTIDSLCILQGYGNGSFVLQETYQLDNGSSPYSITLGDMNNDDHLDIVVANFRFNRVDTFLGLGNGSFSQPKKFFISESCIPTFIKVVYCNDDDRADVALVCTGDSAIIILFGTQDGSFFMGRKYITSSNSAFKTIAFVNLNNDSYLDLVVANTFDSNIDIFHGNRSEPFAFPRTISTGFNSKPQFVTVGDFDNDNRFDFVIANYGTDSIGIILASEIENSSDPITYYTGANSRPYALAIDDFNDDNQLDIAVVNSATNDVIIFEGYGNGLFIEVGSYSTGVNSMPFSIAVSDFNNDKQLDFAVANAGANNILLVFGLGNGTFGNEISYSMGYGSRPYSLAAGDFNNDNWVDIAVTNFEADYVEILLQTCYNG